MKCPGCSYSSNEVGAYSAIPSASYLANMGSTPQALYSQNPSGTAQSYSAVSDLPAINYASDTGNTPSVNYSMLPSKLDYQITQALLEIDARNHDDTPVSVSNPITIIPSPITQYELIPMHETDPMLPEGQATGHQMQKHDKFNTDNGFMPSDVLQNGAVRITQTDFEEQVIIMRKTRIQKRSITFYDGNEGKRETKRIN